MTHERQPVRMIYRERAAVSREGLRPCLARPGSSSARDEREGVEALLWNRCVLLPLMLMSLMREHTRQVAVINREQPDQVMKFQGESNGLVQRALHGTDGSLRIALLGVFDEVDHAALPVDRGADLARSYHIAYLLLGSSSARKEDHLRKMR